jgi:N6-adenosine-specific RNA methylase IME4
MKPTDRDDAPAPVATDDAILLLWCTWPWMAMGTHTEVIRAWGFERKTAAFVWIKQNESGEGLHTGMGYWTRSNSEVCLLATKGAPSRLATDVHQVRADFPQHAADIVPERKARNAARPAVRSGVELFGYRDPDGGMTWFCEQHRKRKYSADARRTAGGGESHDSQAIRFVQSGHINRGGQTCVTTVEK